MAGAEKEIDTEMDSMEEEEYELEEEENVALSHSQLPNTSLAELNMLLVMLSLVYFSSEECNMHYEEKNEEIIRDQIAETKTCISRLETKKRDNKHEPKIIGRKSFSSRFHTTIKDSR